jgi:FMN phosphatase YigB (HAD superfamily)
MTKVARDTVVFDLGGVLIEWDPRHLYRSCSPATKR